MRVVGYVRVSTTKQADRGVSLAVQESSIRAYCKERGLQLAQIYADAGVSGTLALRARPQGAAMLLSQPDAIVAHSDDRLWRSAADALADVQRWRDGGPVVHVVKWYGAPVDTSTADGTLQFTLRAAIGEHHASSHRERTQAAMARLQANGRDVGRSPFGYRYNDATPRALVEHPAEQATIAKILQLTRDGLSTRKIAKQLNEDGDKPKTASEWSHVSVYRILRRHKAR